MFGVEHWAMSLIPFSSHDYDYEREQESFVRASSFIPRPPSFIGNAIVGAKVLAHQMPNYLVISTSGNPDSNSRRLGRAAFAHLQKQKVDSAWIDISEMDLPLCDADKCYGMPGSKKLSAAIKAADGILVAAPVYNYDVAAAAKNMIELTGSASENKSVGFLCAAGGTASYISVIAYANSLTLDFRCVIIPRFVFATADAFDGDNISDKKIIRRTEIVADELVRFTKALRS